MKYVQIWIRTAVLSAVLLVCVCLRTTVGTSHFIEQGAMPAGLISRMAASDERVSSNVAATAKSADVPSDFFGPHQFADIAKQVIRRLDTRNIGYVTKSLLAKALQDSSIRSLDAQALAALYLNFEQLASEVCSRGGCKALRLSVADIEHYDRVKTAQAAGIGPVDSANLRLIKAISSTAFKVNQQQSFFMVHSLYAEGDPLSSIKPEMVKQGDTGDCYLMADLAAVAHSRPELIRDAITDNHDGTYTVRFRGAGRDAIVVTAPTDAELGLFAPASYKGFWVPVVEKAYGEYLDNHFWQRFPLKIIEGNSPQETAGKGGDVGTVMDLLTGGSHHQFVLLESRQNEIAARLDAALNGRSVKAVSADTSIFAGGLSTLFANKTKAGFPKLHAYTITGFQRDEKVIGWITVRNPHALGTGIPEGTITITLAYFIKNFSTVAIED